MPRRPRRTRRVTAAKPSRGRAAGKARLRLRIAHVGDVVRVSIVDGRRTLARWEGSRVAFERQLRPLGSGASPARPRARALAAPRGMCPVDAIPPITDATATEMEGGTTLIWSGTAGGLRKAAETLVELVNGEPSGSATITSAFRPQAYQDHLRAVWDRANALAGDTSPECSQRRVEVATEMGKHGLKVGRPVAKTSKHTSGRAVDVSWRLPEASDPNARIAELAKQAGLTHPLPDADVPHFELA